MMPFKSTFFCQNKTLNLGGQLMNLSSPIVMGIINLTPDSFYPPNGQTLVNNGKSDLQNILNRASLMLESGASILDLGAMSSRPGAAFVSEAEELKRIIPAVTAIQKEFPNAILSIDTWRANVARRCLSLGAHLINDITGGSKEHEIWKVCAEFKAPYILMHMQGEPENMQNNPTYNNVTQDVLRFFVRKIEQIRKAGVHDIIIDPGFGFGKSIEHNYTLLRELQAFSILELPILVGLSRKSMIWKVLDTQPEDTLIASMALQLQALQNGASILRVHDVKEAVDVLKINVNLG